ncbi:hypothetical protein GF337_00160 [candidate division KSB1 bacterium]|nr:hypothetical protein [candidate division KSB1 bacterium]
MMKKLIFFLSMLIATTNWSQAQTSRTDYVPFTSMAVKFGTGFFQDMQLNLTNFENEVIATSDQLVPATLQAEFNYYFHPKVGLRFSSGYGYSQVDDKSAVNYEIIDTDEAIYRNKSTFKMSGFPVELAIVFRNSISQSQNIFLKLGLGVGYYAYNFRSEGALRKLDGETSELIWEELYSNPELSLSGAAQFFLFGMDINITSEIGATLELSKVGLSFVKVKQDVVEQVIFNREIENQIKYGYWERAYHPQNGLDDIALSVGIFWKL